MSFSLRRYYADPQAISLMIIISLVILGLTVFFDMLLPFWIGLGLAYLQQYPIDSLSRYMSYGTATIVVFSTSLIVIISIIMATTPFFYEETSHFLQDFPKILDKVASFLDTYSVFGVSLEDPLSKIAVNKGHELLGHSLNMALEYGPSAIHVLIYIVTIPVIIFFLNYDKDRFLGDFLKCFPVERPILDQIGSEVCLQLNYYIRGKLVQMFAVGGVHYALFWIFSLNFAALLSIPMALSVFVPFVGTALATMPLLFIAYAQFGLSLTVVKLIIGYGLIQVWEANILVPMIFSQSNDLHPVTILGSILVFGSLLGVVGVFLAIPLAASLKVLIRLWPILPE